MAITTVHPLQRFPLQLPRLSGLLRRRSKPRAQWSACRLPKQRTLREPSLRGSAPPRSGERVAFLAENPESWFLLSWSYHPVSRWPSAHVLHSRFFRRLRCLLGAGTSLLTSLSFHAPENRFVAQYGWVKEM